MRRIVAVAVTILTAAVAMAQNEGAATSSELRLMKVEQVTTSKDVSFAFTFDTDISKRLAEFKCECSRRAADASETLPVNPPVKGGESPTAARVTVPEKDLKEMVAVECTLTHAAPGGVARTVITTTADLALRRDFVAKVTELENVSARLARYEQGVVGAQPPAWVDVTTSPKRAVVRLTGNPCAKYELKASATNEVARTSRSSPGSSTHILEVTDLTAGKSYDLEFYQLDANDRPINSTRVSRAAGIVTPSEANKVAVTEQLPSAVEGGVVIQGKTNVPAVVVVDVREYDKDTGKHGTEKLAPAWPQSGGINDRPAAKDLQPTFRVTAPADPGKFYQYRLRALNADGIETTTDWGDREAVSVPAAFGFTQPVEVAVTPVGFIFSWESSVPPDEVSIMVDYDDRADLISRKEKPGTKTFSMALDPAQTAEFLKTMTASKQVPAAAGAAPAPKPPKLVVYMRKEVPTLAGTAIRTAKQELRILLPQDKAETKTVMANLALTDGDKQKLVAVAEKTIEGGGRNPFASGGTKFNWNTVFNVALKLLVAGL